MKIYENQQTSIVKMMGYQIHRKFKFIKKKLKYIYMTKFVGKDMKKSLK